MVEGAGLMDPLRIPLKKYVIMNVLHSNMMFNQSLIMTFHNQICRSWRRGSSYVCRDTQRFW